MSDFDYNPLEAQAQSWETQSLADTLWATQQPLHDLGDQFWQASDFENMNKMYDLEEMVQDFSTEAYEQSWAEWYGPVNSEGYTAYDASIGYTSTDTSFIEPASSAGSMSMISDNNTSAEL